MALDTLLEPWAGSTFRHLPAGARYDVLDFSLAGIAPNNRWNAAGEPTLYLAGDTGVAIAEFARRLEQDRPPSARAAVLQRRLYRLDIELASVLDLRRADTWNALSLKDAPTCFLDRDIARAVARFIRVTTPAQAIRVPSVAFLDDLSRWSLVVFLEKVTAGTPSFVRGCAAVGTFSIDP